MASWTPQNHIDLWKSPLTIMVAIIILVISIKYLGLELDSISHGGATFKFRKEMQQDNVLLNLKNAEIMRNETKDTTANGNVEPAAEGDTKSLVVSDDIANTSYVKDGEKMVNVFNNVQGFIWLGNSDLGSDKLTKSNLNGVQTLDQVDISEEYIVKGNMVLRANSPTSNVDYFSGESQVGLAPRGSKVKVIGEPMKKDLAKYTQYWVKVEILS